MKELHECGSFAFTARVLGALFYYPPDAPEVAPLTDAFVSGEWAEQWPLAPESLAPLAATFSQPADESLPQAYQRLFVGPWALPAPPWGSVWLDRESVLFGESTLALRQWMRDNAIAFDTTRNEPEDHFGTVLMLAAWLSENERDSECEQLLAWHLLPWAGRFLSLFCEHAAHPFYLALGQLAQLTLAQWQDRLLIPVSQKPLYR